MDIDTVKQLIEALEQSDLKKLVVKEKDFEVSLEKPEVGMTAQVHTNVSQQPIEQIQPAQKPQEGKFITSPMVGTFYSRPAPDEPIFAKAGDSIEDGQVVCIIEAMKVMNEVKAQINGTIAEILVEDGHPVEYGTKIFRIV